LGHSSFIKHLLLLGAGRAHLQLLNTLRHQHPASLKVTLVSPYTHQLHRAMLPGWMAGQYALDDALIAVEQLAQAGSVKWLPGHAVHIDTQAQTVQMQNGDAISYDFLSINTGAVMNRDAIEAQMSGAREHGLFVRPVEQFAQLWPRLTALGEQRALRVAVMGADGLSVEIALAIAQRLPTCRVSLVTGGPPPAASESAGVQRALREQLKTMNVTVLPQLCVQISASEVLLDNGARLVCDAPIVALDAQGFVAVNACGQSASHANVFAAGSVARRVDALPVLSNKPACATLAHNLLTAAQMPAPGLALKTYQPPQRTLQLKALGAQRALASWGAWHVQGRWVRWLKDRVDRDFIAQYRL
jgi:NADH dehydrogenase FAD-containing subunit